MRTYNTEELIAVTRYVTGEYFKIYPRGPITCQLEREGLIRIVCDKDSDCGYIFLTMAGLQVLFATNTNA